MVLVLMLVVDTLHGTAYFMVTIPNFPLSWFQAFGVRRRKSRDTAPRGSLQKGCHFRSFVSSFSHFIESKLERHIL